MRPNLYDIGRSASNQYTGLMRRRAGRRALVPFGRARQTSARVGRPRRRSGILASIVIPFSARLGKLKCRNSWGNIGFLAKKNILLRHCNDGSDITEYFQFIIRFGVMSPIKMITIVNSSATSLFGYSCLLHFRSSFAQI